MRKWHDTERCGAAEQHAKAAAAPFTVGISTRPGEGRLGGRGEGGGRKEGRGEGGEGGRGGVLPID